MFIRQLRAARSRSARVKLTCTSFSASAKVEGDTSGPAGGAVPNAGGAPGGMSAAICALLRNPAAAPSKASEECVKNCLRDFDIFPPKRIIAPAPNPNGSQFGPAFELRNGHDTGICTGDNCGDGHDQESEAGTQKRTTTSFGPDGRLNFVPASLLSFRLAGMSTSAKGIFLVHEPVLQ